uniref:Plasmid replicase n=1 Tax=Thiomonas intermedia (strain K12) TaxID=75379 RepID=D5X778_THIK1
MIEQLSLFAERLPHRPYCSDDKTARLIRSRARALQFPYIQVNPPKLRFWLPFDLDKPGGAVAWEDALLPPPAVAIGNPHNGHAHLLWGLEAPVATGDAARAAPLRYLAAIEGAMLAKMLPHGADPGFAGLIVKNPAHEKWRTHWGPPHLYGLGELAEWLDLDKFKPKRALLKEIEGYGVGRNVSLFNALGPEGKWAYTAVRRYRGKPFGEWEIAVLAKAQEMNGEFRTPMDCNEVRHIAKSVAKWTWKQDKARAAEFSQRQSYKGKRSGEVRAAASEDRRASARLMAASGMTQQVIAQALGVTDRTVRNWIND